MTPNQQRITPRGDYMSKLNVPDEAIRIFKELGITSKDAVWDCHGTPVVLHKYIEVIGAKLNVSIDALDIVESNSKDGIVSMKCVASMKVSKDIHRQVISYGECSPKNNKNAYPYAMAEKRAVDRCILKLANLHGFVYSENEIDDAKPGQKVSSKPTEKKIISNEPTVQNFIGELTDKLKLSELTALKVKYRGVMEIAKQQDKELFNEAALKYQLLESNHTRTLQQ